MLLAGAIEDDAAGLGESVEDILSSGGQEGFVVGILLFDQAFATTGNVKDHDLPTAGGGVVEDFVQLLFFFGLPGLFGRRGKPERLVDFRIGREGTYERPVLLLEAEPAHRQAAHAAVFPGVEHLLVVGNPALDPPLNRHVEKNPAFHTFTSPGVGLAL